MSRPAVDHRRAIADRNATAILDATEQLIADGASLSMAGVASAAGISRPTLYAHFASLGEVVEAALERAVDAAVVAVDAAQPDVGPPHEALMRTLDASWGRLSRQDALAKAAAEHLTPKRQYELHAPLVTRMLALVQRGQADGSFRDDLSAEWLVRMFYAIVHAADEHARSRGSKRAEVIEMLRKTTDSMILKAGEKKD